ncbi:hypothetical protein NUW58_g420 [Xylaria curta]|uniref:Uncharacterized protein n=1 Tax=Xylaria curta TaxID=42375 RepID=A0ACC1PPB4_9PEZI|nr:hypothetical protein NUW58_g420 [Xylaria curta]
MATFHLFPHFPLELRAHIWKMAATARTVEVRLSHEFSYSGDIPPQVLITPHLSSSTPVPVMLHTCSEARRYGPYKRAFSVLDDPNSTEPRYVWLCFEVDTISIGAAPLEDFALVAPLIQRLKFEASNHYQDFFRRESKALSNFVNAKEIYIVCVDDLRSWDSVSVDPPLVCGEENLFFIDPQDGTKMGYDEMIHRGAPIVISLRGWGPNQRSRSGSRVKANHRQATGSEAVHTPQGRADSI